jgi:hypothetical protein
MQSRAERPRRPGRAERWHSKAFVRAERLIGKHPPPRTRKNELTCLVSFASDGTQLCRPYNWMRNEARDMQDSRWVLFHCKSRFSAARHSLWVFANAGQTTSPCIGLNLRRA